MSSKSQEKAWTYVGRFMESFANVEAAADSIFEILFNLGGISMALLQSTLDFRKKLKLIQLGFKHLGIEHGDLINKIQEFCNIRNAIAHSQFEPVPSWSGKENGVKVRYEAGVDFSYIDQKGQMEVPRTAQARNRKQKEMQAQKKLNKGKEESDYYPVDNSTITYSTFDEYDAQLKMIMGTLVELAGSVTPIHEGFGFVRDIRDIVASSENVVLFKRPASKE